MWSRLLPVALVLVPLFFVAKPAYADPDARERAYLAQAAEAQLGQLASPTGEAALADTLWQMGARETTVRLYRRVAVPLAGGEASRTALVRVVSYAVLTGDFGDVDALLPQLPDPMWPEDRLVRVAYRRGVLALQAGDLPEATTRLESVPQKHVDYTAARYLLGVARVRSASPEEFVHIGPGDLKEGVRAFTDVIQTRAEARTMAELRHLDHLRDLAILDVARVYYAIARYAEQVTWAGNVPRTSVVWRRAQVEAAWGELALYRPVAPRLSALGDHPDEPEVDLILGLDAVRRCDLEGAEQAGRRLAEAIAAQRRVVEALTAQRGQDVSGPVLEMVVAKMAADREITGLHARAEALEDQERELGAWLDPVSALDDWLGQAHRDAREELAARIVERGKVVLAWQGATLDRLAVDAEALLHGIELHRRGAFCSTP